MKRLAPPFLVLSVACSAIACSPRRGERTRAPASPRPATSPTVLAVSTPAATQPAADPLAARLRPLLHRLDSARAVVAARVIELPSGRELYAERADEAVIPASNMKLPVSAAVLDRFGPDHELKTYLAVDGDDLWLIGTGDPATGDPGIAKKRNEKPTAMLDRWAAALRARGVTAVNGNLYYYDGAFDDERVHPTWSRSFLTDWYAAPVAGLNFNDNCVDVTVRPAADGQAAAYDVMPPTGGVVEVVNRTVSKGEGDAEIDRSRDANVFTLKGGVRAEKSLESKPVTDPGAFFADALRTNLATHGIAIAGQTRRAEQPLGGLAGPPAEKVVAVHATPLRDVLWRINKNSQNLFAESVCKYLGRAYEVERGNAAARGSWETGGEAVKAFLAGQGIADADKYVVVDGSGLARGNRVTARGQTDLLLAMSRHRYAEAFGQSLAVAGVDGTIGKRSKDIAGRVFAKTGYIGGVRALSGYVRTRENQWLAFSIIYNQIPGSVKPYEELQDDACRLMVEWPAADRAVLRSTSQPTTGPATRPYGG